MTAAPATGAPGRAAAEPGRGEPLVLIHGLGATWRVWMPVLDRLRAHHPVLAVKLAGHYEAAPLPPGVAPSVSALADAIERDMDSVGVDRAHLAGNSLGGELAFELAKRGRARTVVAISPSGGLDPDSVEERRVDRRERAAHLVARALAPYSTFLMRRNWRRWLLLSETVAYPSRVDRAEAAYALRAFARCPIHAPLLDAMRRDGPVGDLDTIDCPVRIVWGTADRDLPLGAHAPALLAALPGAQLTLLPGLGHVPMSDDPDAVADAILAVTAKRAGPPPQLRVRRAARSGGVRPAAAT